MVNYPPSAVNSLTKHISDPHGMPRNALETEYVLLQLMESAVLSSLFRWYDLYAANGF